YLASGGISSSDCERICGVTQPHGPSRKAVSSPSVKPCIDVSDCHKELRWFMNGPPPTAVPETPPGRRPPQPGPHTDDGRTKGPPAAPRSRIGRDGGAARRAECRTARFPARMQTWL